MTENKDDKMVERFLMEHSGEMPDRGFSHRVMRSLPDKAVRYNRVWTAVYGVAVVILLVKVKAVKQLYASLCAIIGELVNYEMDFPDVKMLLVSVAVLAVVVGWNRFADEYI